MGPIDAAKKGCGICSGPIRLPPSGDPFYEGPYAGRYWCDPCWNEYYDEHPEFLADEESRRYVAEEARKTRARRTLEKRLKERHGAGIGKGAEILFEEGENRIFLTERGTLLFSLECGAHLVPDEFDPARFSLLVRAVEVLRVKMPQYANGP